MKVLLFILLLFAGSSVFAVKPLPSDSKSTKETIKLYQNLIKLQKKGIMFGHQDDLVYGHGWYSEHGKSDVKDVCGDYPAVYGWELGHLELGDKYSLDSVFFDRIKEHIKTVYKRGGINTISWHLRNPLTGGSAWDVSSKEVVKSILPGGSKHVLFKQYLDKLAIFLLSLKTEKETYIPILFRPFHEHTGSWFWWGKNLCTVEEYKSLWRFTVNYLQNEKGIHHLLYCYSTDRFNTIEDYLERYPGDEIIDLLSFDIYDRGSDFPVMLKQCVEMVSALASQKQKPAAISETGGPLAKNHEWWTKTLYPAISAVNISYVLVWRNPWQQAGHGAFAPYKGSPDSNDFVKFYDNKKTLFQKEVSKEKLYN